MNIKHLGGAIALTFFTVTMNAQALKAPAPSPSQTLKQSFALGEITIEYSRPAAKGRVIFGDLVPYGKIWRTGANAATKITFTDEVSLDGKSVKPGTYALYSIPGQNEWELMLYSDLSLGGNVAGYKTENEVFRTKVKPVSTADKTESFTIDVADVLSTSATLELRWDKVRIPLRLTAEIDEQVMKSIDATMSKDPRPYHQAANYYYENNKDLKKALEWINKAIENNPSAFWSMLLKARIQLRSGDKAGAIATAEKTLAAAKEANNGEYEKMAGELIAEAKKK